MINEKVKIKHEYGVKKEADMTKEAGKRDWGSQWRGNPCFNRDCQGDVQCRHRDGR
jgi:hypothetical protein